MYRFLDFVRETPLRRALFITIAVFLLLAPAQFVAQADPVTLFYAFITLVTGAVVVVVVDYFVCGFDIFFYCDKNGNIIGSVGPDGEFIPIGGSNNNQNNNNNQNGPRGPRGNNGNGPNGLACASTGINACGMRGTGFIVNGVCNATPPPNSSCPVPVIGDEGFYADPARVREGNTTTLYWDVTDATVCALSGGGLTLLGLGILGSNPTNEINAATAFTLTCQNGLGGPETSEDVTVTIVPSYEEI